MSTESYFRQCELRKETATGNRVQVTWIPERHAFVGKHLKLKDGDAWTDGWCVLSVGATRRSAAETRARSQDHKSQRGVSDI